MGGYPLSYQTLGERYLGHSYASVEKFSLFHNRGGIASGQSLPDFGISDLCACSIYIHPSIVESWSFTVISQRIDFIRDEQTLTLHSREIRDTRVFRFEYILAIEGQGSGSA